MYNSSPENVSEVYAMSSSMALPDLCNTAERIVEWLKDGRVGQPDAWSLIRNAG